MFMRRIFANRFIVWEILLNLLALAIAGAATAESEAPLGGWQMREAAKVNQDGAALSRAEYDARNWYGATVPGTVLTTLVNNGVYPEPLYGENNRPDRIPDSLCRQDYWYRAVFTAPKNFAGKKIWLNFDGINYAAQVWVNGQNLGSIKGAFTRGVFDISPVVEPGRPAALAVLISPQPHPGTPHEHTLAQGMGKNGGITAVDGPTFLCALGWDWIPAIRDRDAGIWQRVFLSATGPVVLENPLVTTELPLPDLTSADVGVQVTLRNVTEQAQAGVLKGNFGDAVFEQPVEITAHSAKLVSLAASNIPALHVKNPKLWWPNGYGPQNLYTLHLKYEAAGTVSDAQDVTFGVRKISYAVADSDNLTISVNGVRVFCKGGDWGMDEAMKRNPRERLEAQIRMHQLANYTIIRNWVGQSTSEDFYELCDKYGILLWDEFFQPNPGDGPNPPDLETYLANVREKIVRFRNHPSVAVWCARNEGFPPKEIDARLRTLMAELEPTRLYQPSSTSGRGVNSGGPYSSGHAPRQYYDFGEAFKTEIGSASIPTLESIQGMMPAKDWETINDDWAEHDLASGASAGPAIRGTIEKRYGKIVNLADFVRKAQLLNYETFRAIYEGREARMFHPATGVIIWMSNPAQPSFVWQIYHHDLEPNASLFAVKEACEPVHLMLNEKTGHIMVINNRPVALEGAKARVLIYNLAGKLVSRNEFRVAASASEATDLGSVLLPPNLSAVYFAKMELQDAGGHLLSDNFYWRAAENQRDDLRALNDLPTVRLAAKVKRHDADGKCQLAVTLRNPGSSVALLAHLQLRGQKSSARVLPVYYSDNYLSLVPGESRTVTIEAALADLKGETPLVALDGWNVDVKAASSGAAAVAVNQNAQVSHWPETGLPVVLSTNTYIYAAEPAPGYRISCGGSVVKTFDPDEDYHGGSTSAHDSAVDTSAVLAGPEAIYHAERWGEFSYEFPVKPLPAGQTYTVRLHFAETSFKAAGGRRFQVEINGRPVLADFDVFKEAGGGNKALVREFPGLVPTAENKIVIQFKRGAADYPEINAIEIKRSDLQAAGK